MASGTSCTDSPRFRAVTNTSGNRPTESRSGGGGSCAAAGTGSPPARATSHVSVASRGSAASRVADRPQVAAPAAIPARARCQPRRLPRISIIGVSTPPPSCRNALAVSRHILLEI